MPHISFSELKNWAQCPFYHKLTYLDKIKLFKGNEHTAFGSAIHSVCEHILITKDEDAKKLSSMFQEKFLEQLSALKASNMDLDKKLVESMRDQGNMLVQHVLPAVKEQFGDFELISCEEKLYEPIEEYQEYKFKGYIDLVLKTKDGTYHVIDWKTCSWGWDMKRKTDPITNYQLTLYKDFFAKKHNLDSSKIKTYFALLKRTAKKNNAEIFHVTSGPKKTNNALKLLHKALYNITNEKFIKNKLSCGRCEFRNTEYCP